MAFILLECSRLLCQSIFPHFLSLHGTRHTNPVFLSEIGVTCLLWFCGNSLTALSSWPLDEPVYSSSHSKAAKILWATRKKETPSVSSLHLLLGCAGYGLEPACIRLCLLYFFPVLTCQNCFVTFSKQNTKLLLCCPTGERSSTQGCYGTADNLSSPIREAEQRQSLPWRAFKHCLMSPFDPVPNVPELTLIFRCFPHLLESPY